MDIIPYLDWQLVEKYYGNYTFFYNGPFSNWYLSLFTDGNIKFSCSEQFMMYHKAITFNDHESANKILESDRPDTQKRLGRKVKNFDTNTWNKISRGIVYEGCYLKFTQNLYLKEQLLETKGTLLVEASPTDKIWGIGKGDYEENIQDVKSWNGANWLGEVLTVLRENLETGGSNPYT